MQVIKGTRVCSLGRDGPLEEEMATHPVFLPGELHGQRSLAGYVHGAAKIRHDWARAHIYLAALGLGCGLQDLSDPLWCMWDLLLWCVNPWMQLWDLVRWPGFKPRPPALGTWSLTHWNTSARSVAKSHLTLCTPVDCGPPGFSLTLTVTF